MSTWSMASCTSTTARPGLSVTCWRRWSNPKDSSASLRRYSVSSCAQINDVVSCLTGPHMSSFIRSAAQLHIYFCCIFHSFILQLFADNFGTLTRRFTCQKSDIYICAVCLKTQPQTENTDDLPLPASCFCNSCYRKHLSQRLALSSDPQFGYDTLLLPSIRTFPPLPLSVVSSRELCVVSPSLFLSFL